MQNDIRKKRLNEKLMEVLAMEGTDLLAVIDKKSHFLYISSGFKFYTAKLPEALLGKKLFNYVHPEDLEKFKSEFEKIKQSDRISFTPLRVKYKRGGWRWFQATAFDKSNDEDIKGIILNILDITDIIEIQNELKTSEDRIRSLHDSSTNFYIGVDLNGNYTHVNKKFTDEFGWLYPDGKIIGTPSLSSICEYHHQRVQETVNKCLENPGKVFQIDLDKPGRNGNVMSTRWDFICINNAENNSLEIQCVGIDISDKVRYIKDLKESNDRFEMLMHASSECISDLDLNKNEMYLSRGFTKIFGFNTKGLKENRNLFNSLIHPEDRALVNNVFESALRNKEDSFILEYRMLKADGYYAYIHDKATIIHNENGTAERVLAVLKDISRDYFNNQLEVIEKEVIKEGMKSESSAQPLLRDYLSRLNKLLPALKPVVYEIKNKRFIRITAPAFPEDFSHTLQKYFEDESGLEKEFSYWQTIQEVEGIEHHPDWRPINACFIQYSVSGFRSLPLFNSEDELIGILLNFGFTGRHDLTEQQIMDKAQKLIAVLLARFQYIESIQNANQRFTYINKASNEAIYDWDINNDCLEWGDGLERIFGHIKPDSNLGIKHWENLLHPIDRQTIKESLEDFLQNKDENKWRHRYRFKRGDGSFAFVEETGYLIRSKKNNPKRMIGSIRDISEIHEIEIKNILKQKVSEIFKSNKNLNQVLSQFIDFVAGYSQFAVAEIWLSSYDNAKLHMAANYASGKIAPAFYKESTPDKSFIEGDGLPGSVWQAHNILFWDDIDSRPDFIRQSAARKAQLKSGVGIPLLHKDVLVGVMILMSHQKIEEYKNPLNYLEVFKDFLGGEIRRKQNEEEMHLLFHNAPEMMAIVSPEGNFIKINPAFCKILGYSEQDVINKAFTEFLHPDDLKRTHREFSQTITGERQSSNFINRYLTASGKYRWISWSSSPNFGNDGLFFAYGKDVSEIKELENLLENAAKLARIGSWELDLENENLYFSPITKEIHELEKDFQPDLSTGISFYPEDHRPLVRKLIAEAISEGKSWDFELPIVTGKGNKRWVRSIGKPEIVNGICTKIYGSFQDIHRQKSAEIELQKALEERSTILESIGDAFFTLDKNWNITYWNKQAEQMLGKNKSEVIGESLWKAFPDAKNTRVYKEYNKSMKKGVTSHFEEFYTERKQWFDVSAYPSDNGISVYFKDISIRKRAEEQIRETTERYKNVVEATNDAIWDYNFINGNLIWAKGFHTLFGYGLKDVKPEFNKWIAFIHPDDRNEVKEKLQSLIAEHEKFKWHHEYRFLKSDGEYAYVVDRAIILRDKSGKAIRAIGAMTDITYRKNYEESLKKLNLELEKRARELAISNTELEQFAYVASHDLQEPLRMVSSFLTQLERKYGDELDGKAQRYIHFAVDGAKRMRQIILDLLAFSRVGKSEDAMEDVPLSKVLDEVKKLLHRQIETKEAVIKVGRLPTIKAYYSPLIQIFQNLLSNALLYIKDGVIPEIIIKSEEREDHWLISVSDNGIGIKQEYFDKVFVIFQRLHNNEDFIGTGMGLSIVKKNVENLGGKVWVNSKNEKGSTFYFTLPK